VTFCDKVADGATGCWDAPARFNARTGVYRVRLPAAWIKRAAWIRVGGGVYVYKVAHGTTVRTWQDAPLSDKPAKRRGQFARLSPRIGRG
jgi:hypothetical protein